MRKVMVGFALFVIIAVAAYLRFHHKKGPIDVAYAGNRQVTLWSTTAQVREPVAIVNFGERLDVLDSFEEEVRVRASSGATGWVNERELLSAELWDQARSLDAKAAAMSVEARGHTKVLGNLHLDAGRDAARIRQLSRDVPLDLLARQSADVPAANRASTDRANTDRANTDEDNSPSEPVQAKKEDWWLVRAHPPAEAPFSGWILGRFIELDVPAPLPDYASSAGTRIVAWFDLNHAKDSAGNPKTQYLLLGAKGPEGQACDFSSVRVYTWGVQRNRYETAFVDSGMCGKLPVELTRSTTSAGDLTFSFDDLSHGASIKRTYRMHQTIVRRVKEPGETKPRKQGRP
jgi:hypothetical protein